MTTERILLGVAFGVVMWLMSMGAGAFIAWHKVARRDRHPMRAPEASASAVGEGAGGLSPFPHPADELARQRSQRAHPSGKDAA